MATYYKADNSTWYGWVTNTTASSTAAEWYEPIWRSWTTGSTTTINYNTSSIVWNPDQVQVFKHWQVVHEQMIEDGDARQARLEAENARRLEAQRRAEKQAEERLVAHARGLELLAMLLTPEQAEQRRTGKIKVRGSEGGLFEIDLAYAGYNSVHGNVTEIDEHGCILGRICVAPKMYTEAGALPASDGYVGQLLAIETNEADFRAKGHWSGRRECVHPEVPVLRAA